MIKSNRILTLENINEGVIGIFKPSVSVCHQNTWFSVSLKFYENFIIV